MFLTCSVGLGTPFRIDLNSTINLGNWLYKNYRTGNTFISCLLSLTDK